MEIRAFLKTIGSNFTVKGKKLEFLAKKPFQIVAERPPFSTWLALLKDFRTLDWAEEYKYPTVILSQMKQLLAEHQEG